jgi:hypothetical protein
VSDKSFTEKYNFLRSHAIRHEQQNKERSSRQIHNIYQSPSTVNTKNDKIKTVLVLINELQTQDSDSYDDKISTQTLSSKII